MRSDSRQSFAGKTRTNKKTTQTLIEKYARRDGRAYYQATPPNGLTTIEWSGRVGKLDQELADLESDGYTLTRIYDPRRDQPGATA